MDANRLCNGKAFFNCVSIHAPVMDAKPIKISASHVMIVSIHAPVMDAKSSQRR